MTDSSKESYKVIATFGGSFFAKISQLKMNSTRDRSPVYVNNTVAGYTNGKISTTGTLTFDYIEYDKLGYIAGDRLSEYTMPNFDIICEHSNGLVHLKGVTIYTVRTFEPVSSLKWLDTNLEYSFNVREAKSIAYNVMRSPIFKFKDKIVETEQVWK